MMKSFCNRFGRSLQYAWSGLVFVLRNEANMRIHLVLAAIAILLAFAFKFSSTEWSVLIITIALVFTAEAINTAIEVLTNMVSPEYHPKARIVKDVAAAAVLITAFMAVIVAMLLYLPKFFL